MCPPFLFVKLSVKYVNVLKNSHFTAFDFSVCNGISFPDLLQLLFFSAFVMILCDIISLRNGEVLSERNSNLFKKYLVLK